VSQRLTPNEAFHKYVVTNERITIIKELDAKGWITVRCPARRHGKPLRMRVGDSCHIFYTDLGGCPEPEIFAALVKAGIPGEYLKRPKGGKQAAPVPKHGTEEDTKLSDTILGIAFGAGSATERLIRIALLAADGELPEGPMVEVFAANLRVSPASIYRTTAEDRRRDRMW
jgi:hypothetical protein